jgi:ribonuclease M5
MRKLRQVVVVEGRYDKDTLSQVVDAVILETSGFGVFNDRQKQSLLRRLAEKRGLIVLTDSDGAGFVIRNFIRSCVPEENVKHAYIPDRYGKERRKKKASKEGKLGVEGMRPEILLDALIRAGAAFEDEEAIGNTEAQITKTDLFIKGLSGGEGSREKRLALIRMLDLPEHLSANALLDVLNALMSREEFIALALPDPPRREEG